MFKRAKLFRKDEKEPVDRRKFEAELPNDIWQSDVMHGPRVVVDNRLRKSFLFAFIDDMSRFIPYAQFHLTETLDSFLSCFKPALVSRGVPRKLYVDNGAVYRSIRLQYITASLGIALIHSKPYEPEERGKIERWFKTIRMQFLPTCPREMTLEELNRRLEDYVHEYNTRIHSSINTTPLKRYLDHIHVIRQAEKHIDEYFRIQVGRTVYKDRSVHLNSMLFEAPLGLAGKKVQLLYHDDDPLRIEVMYQNQSYGFLTLLDLHANVHIKRDRERTGQNGTKKKGEAPLGESPGKGGLLFEQPREKEDNHD
jgi:transposase InsO family protein